MKPRFTIRQLERLKADGKIRGFKVVEASHDKITLPAGRIVTKAAKKGSKEKSFIEAELVRFCNANGFRLLQEHRFHETRKWRFDWAIPELRIAVEYEGVFSGKSRHTTVGGYSNDTTKYREAALLGWKVLRYTAVNYRQMGDDLSSLTES